MLPDKYNSLISINMNISNSIFKLIFSYVGIVYIFLFLFQRSYGFGLYPQENYETCLIVLVIIFFVYELMLFAHI